MKRLKIIQKTRNFAYKISEGLFIGGVITGVMQPIIPWGRVLVFGAIIFVVFLSGVALDLDADEEENDP